MSLIARWVMRYLTSYKIQERGFKPSTVGFVNGSQLFESLVPVISHQNQVLVLKISSPQGDFPQSSQVSIPGAICGRADP